MKLEDSGLKYRKSLIKRGFSSVEDVVTSIKSYLPDPRLHGFRYMEKLIEEFYEGKLLSSGEHWYALSVYRVTRDFSGISTEAICSRKAEKSKAYKILVGFSRWLESMGIPSSEFGSIALLYEIGKLQESVSYCLERCAFAEEGDFFGRLVRLCSYLRYVERIDPKRYHIVGYIFTGVSARRISRLTGIEDARGYLRGIAEEIGGVVQVFEACENIDKCKFKLPSVDLEELNLSMAALYRLGMLEITKSEELYLLYRLGVLENRRIFPESIYLEIISKAGFLRA